MNSFLYILAFYFAGEALSELLHLPFPGSIAGFFLALLAVLLVPTAVEKLRSGSELLLGLLPLFLAPVAVSVFFLFMTSEKNLYFFAGIVLVALLFGILLTALMMKYLMRFFLDAEKKPAE